MEYKGDETAMLIFLPKPRFGLSAALQKLNGKLLSELIISKKFTTDDLVDVSFIFKLFNAYINVG